MNPIPNVKEREPGKIPSTAVTNEIARAIFPPSIDNGDHPPPLLDALLEIWLVWDEGPDGEANKTNHQYWLRRAFVNNNSGTSADKPQLEETDTADKYPDWILATDLSGRPPNTGGTENNGAHTLTKGTAVGPVWPETDLTGTVRWVFQSGGNAGVEILLINPIGAIGYYEGKPVIWNATADLGADASIASLVDLTATNAGTAILLLNEWEIDSTDTSPQFNPSFTKPRIFRAFPSSMRSNEVPPRPVWTFKGIPRC